MKSCIKLIILAIALVYCTYAKADNRKNYIHQYKHIAIREMRKTGIPASISLAQGILESGNGLSELAVKANNHFGIKCHNWEGHSYTYDDDEENECFRKYKNPEQSWIDHSTFLTTRSRYASLFDLESNDYKGWAKGLKAAGYATNPKYAELLINIIEEEELYRYDDKHYSLNKDIPEDKHVTIQVTSTAIDTTNINNPTSYRLRVEKRNDVPCIVIQQGDTYYKISTYFGIKISKLYKYNDTQSSNLSIGDIVYLKTKKTKTRTGAEYHIVKKGDTMRSISQQYGIKLRNLARNNYYSEKEDLTEGDIIYLKGKAKLY